MNYHGFAQNASISALAVGKCSVLVFVAMTCEHCPADPASLHGFSKRLF